MHHTPKYILRSLAAIAVSAGMVGAGHATSYSVSDASGLKSTLGKVKAGDTIVLASGTYSGSFVAAVSGSSSSPITLRGPSGAVLTNSSGYGFYLNKVSYWVLDGFTVANSSKGIVMDGASHNTLKNLTVHDIGDEGVHFRAFSTYNTLQNSTIYKTGKSSAGYGEGVYMGSANSNWSTYSGGKPDKSDYNKVLDNYIGPNVTAEGVDIKEGSTGGTISGNTFDGAGISGANYADSVIDVKGNSYTISGNKVINSSKTTKLADGFQVHNAYAGWGNNNTFKSNTFTLYQGYGINVASGVTGNKVCTSNTVSGGAKLTNVSTTSGC